MPKSLFAIYLAKTCVDVSLALQVQPQTDVAQLRDAQGRTTELEWTWTENDGESCETACSRVCAGATCSSLDRCEIDSTSKMADLEAEMGTSTCASYQSNIEEYAIDPLGPRKDGKGNCWGADSTCSSSSCTDTTDQEGSQLLCPCEVTLGTCSIIEDPHIHVFDEAQVSMLLAGNGTQTDNELIGEKWLVKSDRVEVQARFENIGESKVFTRAVALSGEIMNNNVLTVGSLEDQITWNGGKILDDQESGFYLKDGSFFINATRGSSSLIQDPSKQNLGVDIRLPSGVRMVVNRQHHYVNVAIRMPKQPSGQEGLCGNFNGLGVDDTLEMVTDRFDPSVTEENSFFFGLSYD